MRLTADADPHLVARRFGRGRGLVYAAIAAHYRAEGWGTMPWPWHRATGWRFAAGGRDVTDRATVCFGDLPSAWYACTDRQVCRRWLVVHLAPWVGWVRLPAGIRVEPADAELRRAALWTLGDLRCDAWPVELLPAALRVRYRRPIPVNVVSFLSCPRAPWQPGQRRRR